MAERRSEKLTEWFVELYKVKGIVSTNAIELKLPSFIKIHPVVNISQVQLYRPQVEGQRKTLLKPVIIKEEEEFKVEKNTKQKNSQGEEKVLSTIEEIYGRGRYLGKQRKPEEYKGAA